MFDKKKFDDAVKHLGPLTEGQKAILNEAKENGIPEKELFEKLGVDLGSFAAFMKETAKEKMVFSQTMSDAELATVSAGYCDSSTNINCERSHFWKIYDNGFPHCANTVEDGSWCWATDACFADSIEYVGMKECKKAWR